MRKWSHVLILGVYLVLCLVLVNGPKQMLFTRPQLPVMMTRSTHTLGALITTELGIMHIDPKQGNNPSKKDKGITLSKYIWNLKEERKDFQIKWRFVDRGAQHNFKDL